MINFSLFLNKDAPLYKDIANGIFKPANELENLMEAHRLIERIDTELQYDGFHDALGFRIWGRLPRDKAKLLRLLDDKISECRQKDTRYAFDVQLRSVIDRNAHVAEKPSRQTAYL